MSGKCREYFIFAIRNLQPMNKQKLAAIYRRHIETAKTMKAVAEQQIITATQIESEATAFLDELGVQKGGTRKGKEEITPAMLKILANLTK